MKSGKMGKRPPKCHGSEADWWGERPPTPSLFRLHHSLLDGLAMQEDSRPLQVAMTVFGFGPRNTETPMRVNVVDATRQVVGVSNVDGIRIADTAVRGRAGSTLTAQTVFRGNLIEAETNKSMGRFVFKAGDAPVANDASRLERLRQEALVQARLGPLGVNAPVVPAKFFGGMDRAAYTQIASAINLRDTFAKGQSGMLPILIMDDAGSSMDQWSYRLLATPNDETLRRRVEQNLARHYPLALSDDDIDVALLADYYPMLRLAMSVWEVEKALATLEENRPLTHGDLYMRNFYLRLDYDAGEFHVRIGDFGSVRQLLGKERGQEPFQRAIEAMTRLGRNLRSKIGSLYAYERERLHPNLLDEEAFNRGLEEVLVYLATVANPVEDSSDLEEESV